MCQILVNFILLVSTFTSISTNHFRNKSPVYPNDYEKKGIVCDFTNTEERTNLEQNPVKCGYIRLLHTRTLGPKRFLFSVFSS